MKSSSLRRRAAGNNLRSLACLRARAYLRARNEDMAGRPFNRPVFNRKIGEPPPFFLVPFQFSKTSREIGIVSHEIRFASREAIMSRAFGSGGFVRTYLRASPALRTWTCNASRTTVTPIGFHVASFILVNSWILLQTDSSPGIRLHF